MPIVYYWLLLAFVFGAVVGSFLNVAISRLPFEKSLFWPGSRCGNCYQRIRWYDNLPLVSYLWLRGRCRICGVSFSPRYFLVELCTALGFTGLFYVEVVVNVHRWPTPPGMLVGFGFFPWQSWVGYGFHAILFAFLMVAAVCDLEGREIPFPLTFTGAIIGLIGAVLMPWPWPSTPQLALPQGGGGNPWAFGNIGQGVYPWPVWGPPPAWLPPGSWQMGLATGLAGLLVGTFMLRAVGFLFSKGLGREALGLGDADLMMMAGCFLGWQPVVVAFFVSVVPALFFGLFQWIVRRENELPFGPSLAAGLMITLLAWQWIGAYVQPVFYVQIVLFSGDLLLILAGTGAIFMIGSAYVMRLLGRGPRPPEPEAAPSCPEERKETDTGPEQDRGKDPDR